MRLNFHHLNGTRNQRRMNKEQFRHDTQGENKYDALSRAGKCLVQVHSVAVCSRMICFYNLIHACQMIVVD